MSKFLDWFKNIMSKMENWPSIRVPYDPDHIYISGIATATIIFTVIHAVIVIVF